MTTSPTDAVPAAQVVQQADIDSADHPNAVDLDEVFRRMGAKLGQHARESAVAEANVQMLIAKLQAALDENARLRTRLALLESAKPEEEPQQ